MRSTNARQWSHVCTRSSVLAVLTRLAFEGHKQLCFDAARLSVCTYNAMRFTRCALVMYSHGVVHIMADTFATWYASVRGNQVLLVLACLLGLPNYEVCKGWQCGTITTH